MPSYHAHITDDCGRLSAPSNGAVQLSGTRFLDTAVFSCHRGYQLSGPSGLTCQLDASWDNLPPVCVLRGKLVEYALPFPVKFYFCDLGIEIQNKVYDFKLTYFENEYHCWKRCIFLF